MSGFISESIRVLGITANVISIAAVGQPYSDDGTGDCYDKMAAYVKTGPNPWPEDPELWQKSLEAAELVLSRRPRVRD